MDNAFWFKRGAQNRLGMLEHTMLAVFKAWIQCLTAVIVKSLVPELTRNRVIEVFGIPNNIRILDSPKSRLLRLGHRSFS
ncbi:hypothetical protein PQR37_18590 [Paraburkholderia nemoris]|uniref:hypothetical protein n=1 Tax=Paraburkholderia nemoris TaxID=2793076 RepID=UPI0038B90E0A